VLATVTVVAVAFRPPVPVTVVETAAAGSTLRPRHSCDVPERVTRTSVKPLPSRSPATAPVAAPEDRRVGGAKSRLVTTAPVATLAAALVESRARVRPVNEVPVVPA